MEIATVQRKFKYKDQFLEDINPSLNTEQVQNHYSSLYPELTNATILNKGLNSDGELNFEFVVNPGTKG